MIGALTIVQEDVAPIRQNSTVCRRNFPCRLPLSAKDLYIMKRDMYIMESVNNPFAPCFRAAHTLAAPPPLRRHHSRCSARNRPAMHKKPTQRPVVVASVRWAKMDSNHRRRKPADLQSAPFGHSGICPFCVCDGKGRHKSRKHQGFPRFYILFSMKKPISPQKRGKNRFANVFYYSKDWTNCTILTAVMANSRPLFIFSPARSSACCSSLTVSTPLITGTLPVALSRTSPSVVPRQM